MALLSLLRKLERGLLVAVFLTMVVLFVGNILLREFGGGLVSQFAWIEEAVRLLNLFLVFGAVGLALERGRHVGIDTLQQKLPPSARRQVRRLIDLVGLVFSLYLMVLAVRLVRFVLSTGQTSPTLDIPMGWIYLAPATGFALLALRFGLSLVGLIDRYSAQAGAAKL